MLLASRGVTEYYMDFYALPIIQDEFMTPANRGWYFLVSQNLPEGLEIISETHALKVGITPPSGLQEFSGQLLIKVPQNGTIDRLDFIRIIPKVHS